MPLALVAGLALVFLAIVVVGSYTFLPQLAERMVARNVQEVLGLGERPRIELQSDPPPAMLAGRFSGGMISLGDADLGDVRARRVALELYPFDLDVLGSVKDGELRSEEPLSGTLQAVISEEEISRLTKAEAAVPVQDVKLEEDRVLVRSEAPVLGFDVPVLVQGTLTLRRGTLVFEPRRMSALGAPVREQLLAGVDFSYPLGGLPRGARITAVEVGEGQLVLSGEVERIPLNEPTG
jgi:LmeA-like phospholipid-binding